MPDQPVITEPKPKPLGYHPRSRRRDFFHDYKRRFRDAFTRDKVISNLKTLAWVIPLTLLIWVYAEREQVSPYKDEPLPFQLVSVDPNRVITLKPPQDNNLIIDLEGPQARVQQLLQQLRNFALSPQGIRLDVDTSLAPARDDVINTLDLLRHQKIFSENGITVVRCQPMRLAVTIDKLVEREARIVPPPSVTNVEPTSTFDPPVVKLRGPESKLDEAAAANNGQLVLYADIPAEVLRTPGDRTEQITVSRPEKLRDERISILTSGKVKANLHIRAADVVGIIRSMPVWVSHAPGLFDKYKIDTSVFKSTLQNVHVIGPKELVDQVTNPSYTPGPKAWIEVTDADAKQTTSKVPHYDLPAPLKVSDEDQARITVDIRLLERGASD